MILKVVLAIPDRLTEHTMLRLICWGQPSVQALLEQLPQVTAVLGRSTAAAAAQSLQQHFEQPQQISSWSPSHVDQLHHSLHTFSAQVRSYGTDASSSPSTATGTQQQTILQPAVTADASSPSSKQPAAAAGRHRQLADVEQSGFVTLPPQATASGYQETFLAAPKQQPDSSSTDSGSSRVPIQQVQLPQERLRIQLRQEAQEEEGAEEVDEYSITRSLISGAHSFDTAAAAADAAPQLQQQQLSAADRQLLEKLVGIMTKEGKKSRARRLLLDAMHIIKQQVAKGQHA